jgi:hypothetical protein
MKVRLEGREMRALEHQLTEEGEEIVSAGRP